MDIRHLRYFIALAEDRSFIKAADRVGITQSAFSRSIQTLEQGLGFRVVDRSRKELPLTGQGAIVLAHAREAVQVFARLNAELDTFSALASGELFFGCGPLPGFSWAPAAVSLFNQRYPGIELRFEVHTSGRVRRQLEREEFDFFIGSTRMFQGLSQFETQPLTTDRLAFFCHREHPLAGQPDVDGEAIAAYPLVSFFVPQQESSEAIHPALTGFKSVIKVPHLSSVIDIVSQRKSIGLGSEQVLGDLFADGQFVRLALDHTSLPMLNMQVQLGVVSLASRKLSTAAHAMITALRDTRPADVVEGGAVL